LVLPQDIGFATTLHFTQITSRVRTHIDTIGKRGVKTLWQVYTAVNESLIYLLQRTGKSLCFLSSLVWQNIVALLESTVCAMSKEATKHAGKDGGHQIDRSTERWGVVGLEPAKQATLSLEMQTT